MLHIENALKSQKTPKIGTFCKSIAYKVKMDLKNYTLSLVAKGKSHFTEDDALNALGISKIALRAALRRLKKKREIACPLSGFFLIVPPEYQLPRNCNS